MVQKLNWIKLSLFKKQHAFVYVGLLILYDLAVRIVPGTSLRNQPHTEYERQTTVKSCWATIYYYKCVPIDTITCNNNKPLMTTYTL